jgi:hypothetical protein
MGYGIIIPRSPLARRGQTDHHGFTADVDLGTQLPPTRAVALDHRDDGSQLTSPPFSDRFMPSPSAHGCLPQEPTDLGRQADHGYPRPFGWLGVQELTRRLGEASLSEPS